MSTIPNVKDILTKISAVPISRWDVEDICANNHGGNPESVAAHDSIVEAKEKIRLEILAFYKTLGAHGATADDVAAAWNCSHNHVAPRISELKDDGRLVTTTRRRTRSGRSARVFICKEFL